MNIRLIFKLFSVLLIAQNNTTQAQPLACEVVENGCDLVLEPTSHPGLQLQNQNLAGQTVCLPSGQYHWLLIDNVHGSAENPVTVTNCGGQVTLDGQNATSQTIDIIGSQYIHLTGTGDDNIEYGIKTTNSVAHGLNADVGTSDIEIDHLDVSGGYAGISVRTYPRCDGSFSRDNWSLNNVAIHHNYVHDVRGEGMYIGTSHFSSLDAPAYPYSDCPEVTAAQAELHGVSVHNNIVEDIGRDGIQIGGGVSEVEVYNNIIKRYALRQEWGHIGGLQLNSGTVGQFYNNWIEGAGGLALDNAIQYQGGNAGDTSIFNNVIVDVGTAFLTLGRMANDEYQVNFVNNTVVGATQLFYMLCNDTHVTYYQIKNNIFADYVNIADNYWADWHKIVGGGETDSCVFNGEILNATNDIDDYKLDTNLFSEQASEVAFLVLASQDFHLTSVSPAIDVGENQLAITSFDFESKLRSATSFDAGAYRYATPDVEPPALIMLGDNPLVLQVGEAYIEPGVNAIDDIDGELQVNVTGSVDESVTGTYELEYWASDSSGNTASIIREVIVEVAANVLLHPIKINFNGAQQAHLNGWNDYAIVFNDHTPFSLYDEVNNQTGITVAVHVNFCGTGAGGYTPETADSGAMPDQILTTYWYICSGRSGKLVFSGLDDRKNYHVTVLGSRNSNQARVTNFEIDTDVQSHDASHNTSNTAEFEMISPTDSEFSLFISADKVNGYGYINGFILKEESN